MCFVVVVGVVVGARARCSERYRWQPTQISRHAKLSRSSCMTTMMLARSLSGRSIEMNSRRKHTQTPLSHGCSLSICYSFAKDDDNRQLFIIIVHTRAQAKHTRTPGGDGPLADFTSADLVVERAVEAIGDGGGRGGEWKGRCNVNVSMCFQ